MKKTETGRNADRLRALLGSSPTAATEEFVDDQLDSRRSGLESLAARVLATWRRPRDMESIKGWVMSRLVNQNVDFRPDLVEIFRAFDEPSTADWLISLYSANSALRTTLAHALRELPHGPKIARTLIEGGDASLIIDVIRGFMWSRSRYGKGLKILAQHEDERVRRAARSNLALFEKLPDRYR